MDLSEFCSVLPKVELHAHLNGSIGETKIKELLQRHPDANIKQSSTVIEKGEKRTLNECFDMFRVIQRLTDRAEVITEVTKSVIDEFARENVRYLELRSTPRANPGTRLSKRGYIEAVVQGIREYKYDNEEAIDVRFLLSVDRRKDVRDAFDTIELAKEYLLKASDTVIGVDLSGDPCVGCAKDYIPILQNARSSGLKLSLHMAEIKGVDDESCALLSIPPDRIGHGTFLFENKECRDIVADRRIPLEICMTSNVKTRTVESYYDEHHHIHRWLELGQPIVICTDDMGVFSTTLSAEYQIVSQACGMDKNELFKLSKTSVENIFADEYTKKRLRESLDGWRHQQAHCF